MSQNVFSIATNFNNSFNLRQFYGEIRDSIIDSTKLTDIKIAGDVVTLDWSPALTSSEEDTLTAIVAAYVIKRGHFIATGDASTDFGFFGTYEDVGVTKYSGFYRNTRTNKFVFFDNELSEPITELRIDENIETGVSYADVMMKCLEIKEDAETKIRIKGFTQGEILASTATGELRRVTPAANDFIVVSDTTIPTGVSFAKMEDRMFEFQDYDAILENVERSTIDNAAFTIYKTFNITVLREGRFRIGFYFTWDYNPQNRRLHTKAVLDGSIVLFNSKENRSAQEANNDSYTLGEANLSSGAHTIDFKYKTDKFGDAATIHEVRIEIYRVSFFK